MKLKDIKSKIDQYFDNISPEEFYKTLIQYHMKKTVFEGTINGEQFDNVADYNKRMQELLGQGVPVNASSHTNTIEEPTEIPQSVKDTLDSGRMYPGFETMTLSPDFITKALEHDNENVADSLNRYIQETVIPGLNKLNREDLGKYLDNLDKILAYLGEIEQKNENEIDKIDGELKELQEKLDDCSSRLGDFQSIGGVLDLFTTTYSELKDRAIEIASRHINGCGCGHKDPAGARGACGICGCDPDKGGEHDCQCHRDKDSLTGLLRLVNAIFKD